METIQIYNLQLDSELTVKFTMFLDKNAYILYGSNICDRKTLEFLVKRFKSYMDNNFYALAESRLEDMYALVGIDFKNI